MSAQQEWNLQAAVYTRLTAQLAGQGPSGANVEVFDRVPDDPDRLHCRIDSFQTVQRFNKSNKTQQFFTVHVFDRPTTETASARGQKTAKQLQEKVIAALHGWAPSVTGASAIRHEESEMATNDDGLTQHAFSRFAVYIAAS